MGIPGRHLIVGRGECGERLARMESGDVRYLSEGAAEIDGPTRHSEAGHRSVGEGLLRWRFRAGCRVHDGEIGAAAAECLKAAPDKEQRATQGQSLHRVVSVGAE